MGTPEHAEVEYSKETHDGSDHREDQSDAGEVRVDREEGAPFHLWKLRLPLKFGPGGAVEHLGNNIPHGLWDKISKRLLSKGVLTLRVFLPKPKSAAEFQSSPRHPVAGGMRKSSLRRPEAVVPAALANSVYFPQLPTRFAKLQK